MSQARVIPALLLRHGVLVKSRRFRDHAYVGDPINAIRMFNDFAADELFIIDIGPERREGRALLDLLARVSGFVTAPLAVGGGVASLGRIADLVGAGAEKVVISSRVVEDPAFVSEAAREFGSSTIVVCMDVARDKAGVDRVWSDNGRVASAWRPAEFAERMAGDGAGEIAVQSIDRDGMMQGYDLDLVRSVAAAVPVPVVALGGAATIDHMRAACAAGASAVAAGSAFVYFRRRGAVLINYPASGTRGF